MYTIAYLFTDITLEEGKSPQSKVILRFEFFSTYLLQRCIYQWISGAGWAFLFQGKGCVSFLSLESFVVYMLWIVIHGSQADTVN